MLLGASIRFYSTCVPGIKPYGREIWLVNEKHIITTEMNDTRRVKWMSNVSLEDRISAEELMN